MRVDGAIINPITAIKATGTSNPVEEAVMVTLYLACKVPPYLAKTKSKKEGEAGTNEKPRDKFLKLLQRDVATALDTSENYVSIEEVTPILHLPRKALGPVVGGSALSSHSAMQGDSREEDDTARSRTMSQEVSTDNLHLQSTHEVGRLNLVANHPT